MLYWLGARLTEFFGPFRLFTSYLFLAGVGAALAGLLTWVILPKLWHLLPADQGRAHAVGAQASKGKPAGAGIIFVSVFLLVSFLVVPLRWAFVGILLAVLFSMLEGFIDDRSKARGEGGLSEYKLGAMDLLVSILAAASICGLAPYQLWLPLTKTTFLISPWVFIPIATAVIWFTINATNCTDGVDGLSGSLSALAFTYLGGILYGVLGHKDVSSYLLVPHYPDGANWALMAFVMVGCLAGYLWYNASPSIILMGDAGSRPMGLLLGMLVMASGNPFLIVVVAGVVLINGGTGLVKVALLRFFKIGIFKTIRYPLHDHARQNAGWSNTQVLMRFMLLQAVVTPLLLVVLFKVR